MAARLDTIVEEIKAINKKPVRGQLDGLPAWPDDHPANAEGLDRTQNSGRKARGRYLARPPGPVTDLSKRDHLKILEDWDEDYREGTVR